MLRKCNGCGLEAHTEEELGLFINDKRKPYGKGYVCKECSNLKTRGKRRALKYKAIIYLGGECDHCGIEATGDNNAIFDFHHLDRDAKDFTIGNNGTVTFSNIQKELDKCIVLCANCHRMEHRKDD